MFPSVRFEVFHFQYGDRHDYYSESMVVRVRFPEVCECLPLILTLLSISFVLVVIVGPSSVLYIHISCRGDVRFVCWGSWPQVWREIVEARAIFGDTCVPACHIQKTSRAPK